MKMKITENQDEFTEINATFRQNPTNERKKKWKDPLTHRIPVIVGWPRGIPSASVSPLTSASRRTLKECSTPLCH